MQKHDNRINFQCTSLKRQITVISPKYEKEQLLFCRSLVLSSHSVCWKWKKRRKIWCGNIFPRKLRIKLASTFNCLRFSSCVVRKGNLKIHQFVSILQSLKCDEESSFYYTKKPAWYDAKSSRPLWQTTERDAKFIQNYIYLLMKINKTCSHSSELLLLIGL